MVVVVVVVVVVVCCPAVVEDRLNYDLLRQSAWLWRTNGGQWTGYARGGVVGPGQPNRDPFQEGPIDLNMAVSGVITGGLEGMGGGF